MMLTNIPFARAGLLAALLLGVAPVAARAQDPELWEVTPDSEKALQRGLENLAKTQGADGNWNNQQLGIVSMGLLAFLSDGHIPGHGKYGPNAQKTLNFILSNGRQSGLMSITGGQPEMYNHGLTTFVLGQAYGMSDDPRVGPVLDKALKLIAQCQGSDGGWQYVAAPGSHDLSLCVMQAKALRSAMDSGFNIPPSVTKAAIGYVRRNYGPIGCSRTEPEEVQKKYPGNFSYAGSPEGASLAMVAAGVVCMQEYGQYDDWRIPKNVEVIQRHIDEMAKNPGGGPPDAYTLYYVAQALYQVGGEPWKKCYPVLRDKLVRTQGKNGDWGELYNTAVACFVLAIPNRYLPILQEGKIDSLQKQSEKK